MISESLGRKEPYSSADRAVLKKRKKRKKGKKKIRLLCTEAEWKKEKEAAKNYSGKKGTTRDSYLAAMDTREKKKTGRDSGRTSSKGGGEKKIKERVPPSIRKGEVGRVAASTRSGSPDFSSRVRCPRTGSRARRKGEKERFASLNHPGGRKKSQRRERIVLVTASSRHCKGEAAIDATKKKKGAKRVCDDLIGGKRKGKGRKKNGRRQGNEPCPFPLISTEDEKTVH